MSNNRKFAIINSGLKVLFYQTKRGRSPVFEELEHLPKQASAHVYELLNGIQTQGLNAPRIVFRQIEGKLWEMKMDLPRVGGYRIFYCIMETRTILLLHAYTKKSQKTPKTELETARKRFHDALKRGI